jgi:arabinoxylan arabinofuranohydrolase
VRKTISVLIAFLLLLTSLSANVSYADNPVVQTIYTADPAPLVYNDTVYLYTGHDEDNSTWFTMNDWRVYSSKDMVNWTDHGAVLSYKTFSWAKGDAWAGQVVERNGKFYFYVTITSTSLGRPVIGVAVSNSPTGPFVDALGHPLVFSSGGDIDPTVFIDADGQAYLYWGNPSLKYVKLNSDMISYDSNVGIVQVPLTTQGFGTRTGDPSRATLYEEGPWFYKRGSLYYMVYAASGIPENIAYSTSNSPTGPWTYRGVIMPTQGGSFTNHPGIIDFKGHSYFFYHNGALPGGGGFTRSVAVEEFQYKSDGTFPTINMTTNGPNAIATLNPYIRTEAETIAWESGVETEQTSDTGGGINVGNIENGDWIKVKNIDFGSGASSFDVRIASATSGGNIELHLNSLNGPLAGTCSVQNTGGWQNWTTRSCAVSGATGIHDLFFKFTGGSGYLFNLNWWKFNAATSNQIALKSMANNKYVCAENAGAGQLIANRSVAGLWETFTLIANADGTISLKANVNSMYVVAENGGGSPLIANRTAIGQWEKFQMVNNGDGTVSLKSMANNLYVVAGDGGANPLIANQNAIGNSSKFVMEYK